MMKEISTSETWMGVTCAAITAESHLLPYFWRSADKLSSSSSIFCSSSPYRETSAYGSDTVSMTMFVCRTITIILPLINVHTPSVSTSLACAACLPGWSSSYFAMSICASSLYVNYLILVTMVTVASLQIEIVCHCVTSRQDCTSTATTHKQ